MDKYLFFRIIQNKFGFVLQIYYLFMYCFLKKIGKLINMVTLVLVTITGLVFAYFATQNAAPVDLRIANYTFSAPLYIVTMVSLSIGLFLSLIISLIENISSQFTVWRKENRLKMANKEIAQLSNKVHDLEIKNTELETKTEVTEKKDTHFYPHTGAVA